jgi:alkylation response protein AidB-like acyl-CoA dehydrogenase
MEFTLTPAQQAWRQEIQQFIAAELPADRSAGTEESGTAAAWQFARDFNRKLGSRGWLTAAWPKEYGGLGLSFTDQAIYMEEMTYHDAPLGPSQMAVRMAGSTIIVHGTDAQKREHLPRIAAGEVVFCQGFSEPNAGSDLASLQTRAVADGDDFVVNGGKIWTSGAHHADWMILLARTDPEAPKHRGITFFLLDMQTPGIQIQPLINLAGGHGFNQVFFENVRVPRQNVVGEVNRGWYVATTTLDFERSGIHRAADARRILDDALADVRNGVAPLTEAKRTTVRRELAERAIEVEVGALLAYRVASMQDAGKIPNYEASISKLYGSELIQRTAATAARALGLYGNVRRGSARALAGGQAAEASLTRMSTTIAGGTSEVQRGIIATRGLGLPRG